MQEAATARLNETLIHAQRVRGALAARWAAQVHVYADAIRGYQRVLEMKHTRLTLRARRERLKAELERLRASRHVGREQSTGNATPQPPGELRLVVPEQPHPREPAADVRALTPRQREIAALIARGKSNAEIASELSLTPGTVANHVEHILTRLDFRSRVQVAVWALERGLVPAPERERRA